MPNHTQNLEDSEMANHTQSLEDFESCSLLELAEESDWAGTLVLLSKLT